MDSKTEKIAAFNANGVGVANNQLFGLPFTYEESELVYFLPLGKLLFHIVQGLQKDLMLC
jgi:hypothetical protein